MKKRIFNMLLITTCIFCLTACVDANKYKGKGTETLTEHGNVVYSITRGNKSCVTTQLTLYDDNQYEFFTDYEDCNSNEVCNLMLKYTKSIKGTYDYDLDKILEASTNADDKSYDMNNLPEYEIYLGEDYTNRYNTLTFTIEKGKTNKYLNELLKALDIDLDVCAYPDYVNN